MEQKSKSGLSKDIKPVYLAVTESNIPSKMKTLPQWVIWRSEWRDGRWAKVPYRVDGRGCASSTDPETWVAFETALTAYRTGGFDGVGFVFATGGGLVGIDLDHCFTDVTITEELLQIIDDKLGGRNELPKLELSSIIRKNSTKIREYALYKLVSRKYGNLLDSITLDDIEGLPERADYCEISNILPGIAEKMIDL
jgi:hypothetical protein